MRLEVEKSPAGRSYLHIDTSGPVSAEDVDQFAALIAPGQTYGGLPILAVINPNADFSPAARKRFGAMGAAARGSDRIPTAVVVVSTPLRVLLSFVMKVAGASESSRFFAAEAEARTWIVEQIDA